MISKPDARLITGGNVHRIRLARGMTQIQLAELSRVEQGTISRLERGQVLLNCADLLNIATALSTTTDALLNKTTPLGRSVADGPSNIAR